MLLEIIWGPSLHWEQNSSKSPVILTRPKKLILTDKETDGPDAIPTLWVYKPQLLTKL